MIRKLIALALALLLGAAALAEGELIAPAAELAVAEEDEALLGVGTIDEPGYAGFVGEADVMAAEGDVAIDSASFPDKHVRKAAEAFDADGDGALSLQERQAVTALDISRQDVGTVVGVELFENLEVLNCSGNLLTELDVSQNPALVRLNCSKNLLGALDVSGNAALEALDCSGNRLTGLDVSGNAALHELSCRDNRLKALDVSQNAAMTALDCGDNEALGGLVVKDNPDLIRLVCDNCGLKKLNVTRNPALQTLCCQYNAIKALKLKACPALEMLDCSGNRLSALELSRSTALEALLCGGNRLKALDVSANGALKLLHCSDNALAELTLGGNSGLIALGAYGNADLKVIDITGCDRLIGHLSAPWDEASLAFWAEDEPRFADAIAAFGGDEEECLWIDATAALAENDVALYGRLPNSLAGAEVTAKDMVFNGKPRTTALTVKLDGEVLKPDEDYTAEYANNTQVGLATVTLTGAGKYVGSTEANFTIRPRKPTALALKAGKGRLTASWKKVAGVTGYRLRYGLKKNFSDALTLDVEGEDALRAVLKKLRRKTLYYVSVCSVQTVDGEAVCSNWSKAVKLKTK